MIIIIISTTTVMVMVIGDKGTQKNYLRNVSFKFVGGYEVLVYKNPTGHC